MSEMSKKLFLYLINLITRTKTEKKNVNLPKREGKGLKLVSFTFFKEGSFHDLELARQR